MAQSPVAPAADRSLTAGTVNGLVQGDYNTVHITYNTYGAVADKAAGPPANPVLTTARLLPAPFADLLDRSETSVQLADAVRLRSPAELSGQQGIGKSSLLRALCRQVDLTAFASGIAYFEHQGEPVEDVLQFLFATFYDAPADYKPVGARLLRYVQATTAVVVIDDLKLSRDETDYLRNCAANCTFLLADERTQMTEGTTVRLAGLPEPDGRALLERRLKRPLSPAEQEPAHDIWAAVGGSPLSLIQAAALVEGGAETMATLAQKLNSGGAEQLVTAAVAVASPGEKQMMATLSALGSAPVAESHLAAITGTPDAAATMRSLTDRGLVQSHSPAYSAVTSVTGALPLDGSSTTLDRVIGWAGSASDEDLVSEAQLVQHSIAVAATARRWTDAVALTRRVETALAATGRWGAWKSVLELGLAAAQAAGSDHDQGWALHQLGTRSLGLEDLDGSRALLTKAAEVRKRAGDKTGAAASQHNLKVLDVLVARPTIAPRRLGARPHTFLRTLAVVGAAAVALAGLALAGVVFLAPPTPSPPQLAATQAVPATVGQGASDYKIGITGSGYDSSVTVDGGLDVTIRVTSSTSPTTLGVVVTVDPQATVGARDLRLAGSNGRQAICSKCLTITAAPVIQVLRPSQVTQRDGNRPVYVMGQNLVAGARLSVSGTGVTATPLASLRGGLASAFTVASNAELGSRDVTITNPDGGTSTCKGCLFILPYIA